MCEKGKGTNCSFKTLHQKDFAFLTMLQITLDKSHRIQFKSRKRKRENPLMAIVYFSKASKSLKSKADDKREHFCLKSLKCNIYH